jgi:hypothetical protein
MLREKTSAGKRNVCREIFMVALKVKSRAATSRKYPASGIFPHIENISVDANFNLSRAFF